MKAAPRSHVPRRVAYHLKINTLAGVPGLLIATIATFLIGGYHPDHFLYAIIIAMPMGYAVMLAGHSLVMAFMPVVPTFWRRTMLAWLLAIFMTTMIHFVGRAWWLDPELTDAEFLGVLASTPAFGIIHGFRPWVDRPAPPGLWIGCYVVGFALLYFTWFDDWLMGLMTAALGLLLVLEVLFEISKRRQRPIA